MNIDKGDYFYAWFLLPYNLLSFTDFDFWGEIPRNKEAKQVVDNLRAENPDDYFKPVESQRAAVYYFPNGLH